MRKEADTKNMEKQHKTGKNEKIKKLKKGLEMGGKVVYNESKW